MGVVSILMVARSVGATASDLFQMSVGQSAMETCGGRSLVVVLSEE